MKTSRRLIDQALERALDAGGEGGRVFVSVDADGAIRAAENADRVIAAGLLTSPLCGLPVSVKDLFDVAGQVTTAGSVVLRGRPPAVHDSTVVARLKHAGAIIIGRTNMTEFAYSGVGLNPHFGTPANPWDRQRRRIPGGSSSGAAVSVSDGMCFAALGSDTGGSVRIPAALCGLVGFKPTQRRIPRDGVFPLSFTLDSVGPIARSVACCALVDSVLAGEKPVPLVAADLRSKRFAVPPDYFLDGLDQDVAANFDAALKRLSDAGATLESIPFPELKVVSEIAAAGGISAPEAFAYHRRLGMDFAAYDNHVAERIMQGKAVTASGYLDMLEARECLIRTFRERFGHCDAMLCPTVPIIAPEMETLGRDAAEFWRVNGLLLRNPSVANFLDACALTVPSHRSGDAPTGLMLIGHHLADRDLLAAGLAVEQVLNSHH